MTAEILPSEVLKLRNIPFNESFICMFSGGKDCGFALSMALQKSKAVALIHCLDKDNHTSLFHEQTEDIVQAQANAFNIPIVYKNYKWWVRWDKIVKMYKEYKENGVKYVVFGDLRAEGNVDTQIKLCKSAGLIPCIPLYFLPYDYLINEMEKRNIQSIITTITHPSIGSEWLGRFFDRQAYEHFKQIGVDPFGENGEFHTTLINADFFNKPFQYDILDNNGKKITIRPKSE